LKNLLYRGVNEKLYGELNGELRPKDDKPFLNHPKWDQAQWGNVTWGESKHNAIVEHQQHQAGYPTSGISTTPLYDRALFYATELDINSTGYIYVIDRSKCETLGVSVYEVNKIVPFPSVIIDKEIVLVANDFGILPQELVIEIHKVEKIKKLV
jgi:hypothetical protein